MVSVGWSERTPLNMYITICEIDHQSKYNAWERSLKAGALGQMYTHGWFMWMYTLATSCKELTYWKKPWCWDGLGAGGEGDDRRWDRWMASPTRWAWVWVNSRSWWWTGKPGVLWFMGSQRVGHDRVTEQNWTECKNTLQYCEIISLQLK